MATKAEIARFAAHVRDICERGEIIIISWCRRPDDAWAARELDEIHIPRIKSEVSYAVALHEIGHFLGRHQSSPRLLVRERWAWHWAKRAALVWTPRMNATMLRSLAWYEVRTARAPSNAPAHAANLRKD